MRSTTSDLMKAIERLKEDNDFCSFITWVEESFEESVGLLLQADREHIQYVQGYSAALSDLLAKVRNSRETLQRSRKSHRDTL